MGPGVQGSSQPKQVPAFPMVWSITEPVRNGTRKAEHLRVHLYAQLLQELSRTDLGIGRRTHRSKLRLSNCHSVRRVHTVHQALGRSGHAAWTLLVYEAESHIRYANFTALWQINANGYEQDTWVLPRTS
jgi:hypothetical protein